MVVKIFTKLFLLIYTVYCTFAGSAQMPSTDQQIMPSSNDAKLVFASIADPQVSNYMPGRFAYFESASADLRAAEGLDAMVIVGDIAENGLQVEYDLFTEHLGGMDLRYITCVGNHDIRLRLYSQSTSRFNKFANNLNGTDYEWRTHYTETLNGIKFVILNSERTEFEESYFTDETLNWLDSELASQKGELTFVIVHQPLKLTHGLPDVWGSPFNDMGSIGDQSDQIQEILNKYKNIILLTGHEHTGFGEYTYEKIGNIESINIPSFSVANKNAEYCERGLGFITEVYSDHVLFRARNMCEGKWLPEYDINIKIV